MPGNFLGHEQPRASARGVLEFKLRLPGVLSALVGNIFAYKLFIGSDRADEKSLAPDAGVVPVDFRKEVREFLF